MARGDGNGTRARLLAAAEQLFAEGGFEATSVRDVTDAAGANVAAVNYHFGGKENLYLEVFRARVAEMTQLRGAAMAAAKGMDPEADLAAVLHSFVGACLRNMLGGQGAGCFPQLVFRELAAPGPAFEYLMENVVKPNTMAFGEAIRRARPELSEQQATMCVVSLIGMILHFVRARRIIERLNGREYDDSFIDQICEHVVAYSVAGIRGLT